ncbi:MAG: glycoside hydrolase family 127 protein [Clostridia bacterium]|nr:glycoside hydrolase family 127 protein [Clostridia bacterium]
MKTFSYDRVDLTSGYLFEKQEMNRKITIHSVYDRFDETGRIGAFEFKYNHDEVKPHIFWDSDVAKWMEGAAYILKKHEDPALQEKVERLIALIRKNQGEDGYFNIYFTVVEPTARFTNRDRHELYCAGHLIEAAVAYAEATGREQFLHLMEKYVDYIRKVFLEKADGVVRPAFETPGHEEIELALLRLYNYTKNPKHLELAAHFVNTRGTVEEQWKTQYNQSHLPVREQTEAVGHAVRALYLYSGMASLAKETGDEALIKACKTLWKDLTERKMYVTGAYGSTAIGEAFTSAYDLPADTAYAETCAAIAMVFFGNRMLELENRADYADAVERSLYNGVLSGLGLDGKSFFYVNPLEINLNERFENEWGKRKYSITERVECFRCSCCPPNVTRLLASLGNYVYGQDGDTLYVNQYMASTLKDGTVSAIMETDYPRTGDIRIKAEGIGRIALRIPAWCDTFKLSAPYVMENGYAVVENRGEAIELSLDMTPFAVWADPRVIRAENRIAIMRGPVVYCAEAVDNGENLHAILVDPNAPIQETFEGEFGLPMLELPAERKQNFDGTLYARKAPARVPVTLKLIPYNGFANRGESDMTVWLWAKE